MRSIGHLLLTGSPGVGKTTVLCRLVELVRHRRIDGFWTEEIRGTRGGRQGFDAVTPSGERWTISHVGFAGPSRVGRYGVDLAAVDRLADVVERAISSRVELCLVDEIGKMECMSRRFVEAMGALLESEIPTVATVAARGSGFIAEVKRRGDMTVWQVTLSNRDMLAEEAARWVASTAGSHWS